MIIVVTWIIGILAGISLSVGLIATIVVRTEITTNWKRIGKVLIWIIGLIIFRFLLWGFVDYYRKESNKQAREQTPQSILIQKEVVKPLVQRTFTYVTAGATDGGTKYRYPRITPALVVQDDSERVSFRIDFTWTNPDTGITGAGMSMIVLHKTTDPWIGRWDQQWPIQCGGQCRMKKIQTIRNGYCLELSADENPRGKPIDVYLFPEGSEIPHL